MVVGVTTGAARVIDSGMVTAFSSQTIALHVELADGSPFELVFRFESDPVDTELRAAIEASDGRMLLRCVNFDDATGRGSATPVRIAEALDKVYFVHFRVFLFGRTKDRTLHYTLYEV